VSIATADHQGRRPIEDRLRDAGLPPLDRPAWLEIDTAALAGNLAAIRARVGPDTQVWPVVKSDAYGHGAQVSARVFLAAGAGGVCVATLDEARQLRSAGVTSPVLILYPIQPQRVPEAADAGFQVAISTWDGAVAAARAWDGSGAATGGARLVAHLEVDTGLTRMGLQPEGVPAALEALDRPGIEVAAVWSHLATPEEPAFSAAQARALDDAAGIARGHGVAPTHLAATGGLLTGRGTDRMLVRPGLIAYGVAPDGLAGAAGTDPVAGGTDPAVGGADAVVGATRAAREGAELAAAIRPAMRLVARPIRVETVAAGTRVGYGGTWTATQPSRIATLPVGYGDGFVRAYAPGSVLLRGRRVPLVGVVSMDACAVDVTHVPGVDGSDEAVLLGSQGDDAIGPRELARRRTTIPWEVLTGMAVRLTRVYDAPVGLLGVRTLAGETLVRGS
jgi:alanine racemase